KLKKAPVANQRGNIPLRSVMETKTPHLGKLRADGDSNSHFELARSQSGRFWSARWLPKRMNKKIFSFFLDSLFAFGYFLGRGPTTDHSGAGDRPRGCRADSRLAASPS